MAAGRRAACADPAVRAKMSAARKAAWADPAVRAKMSAARKGDRHPLWGKHHSALTKAKMSEAHRRRHAIRASAGREARA